MTTPVFDTSVFDATLFGGGAGLFDTVPFDPAMFDSGAGSASLECALSVSLTGASLAVNGQSLNPVSMGATLGGASLSATITSFDYAALGIPLAGVSMMASAQGYDPATLVSSLHGAAFSAQVGSVNPSVLSTIIEGAQFSCAVQVTSPAAFSAVLQDVALNVLVSQGSGDNALALQAVLEGASLLVETAGHRQAAPLYVLEIPAPRPPVLSEVSASLDGASLAVQAQGVLQTSLVVSLDSVSLQSQALTVFADEDLEAITLSLLLAA